jgi:hypothetical protein
MEQEIFLGKKAEIASDANATVFKMEPITCSIPNQYDKISTSK